MTLGQPMPRAAVVVEDGRVMPADEEVARVLDAALSLLVRTTADSSGTAPV